MYGFNYLVERKKWFSECMILVIRANPSSFLSIQLLDIVRSQKKSISETFFNAAGWKEIIWTKSQNWGRFEIDML